MRTPLPPNVPAAARPVRCLLLALALSACGREGGDERAKASGDAAPVAARTAPAPGADCPTPVPSVDTTLFTGSWDALKAELQKSGITFPTDSINTGVRVVRLCPGCARIPLILRAANTTRCVTPGTLDSLPQGRALPMGMYVLNAPFPGRDSLKWPPMNRGDTLLIFAADTSAPATLVYNTGGTATRAPAHTWEFYYCKDDHTPTSRRVDWRDRGTPPDTTLRSRFFAEENGSYGWMACASGCCQFYTPPPNSDEFFIELPPRAGDPAPDTVGPGRNQRRPAADFGRPFWCKSE